MVNKYDTYAKGVDVEIQIPAASEIVKKAPTKGKIYVQGGGRLVLKNKPKPINKKKLPNDASDQIIRQWYSSVALEALQGLAIVKGDISSIKYDLTQADTNFRHIEPKVDKLSNSIKALHYVIEQHILEDEFKAAMRPTLIGKIKNLWTMDVW